MLALMCDIVIAGKSAQFSVPELLYAIGGAGAYERVLKIASKSQAGELIFTGKRMTAEEA